MTRFARYLLAAGLIASFTAPSLTAQQRDFTPFLIADRDAEVALARTAAPSAISDAATVLVMTRGGLVEAARGRNGFTCFVLRSFSAGLSDSAFWNPRLRAPHCLNAPATETVLPEIRARVEWVLAGVSLAEIASRTEQGYASGTFPLPAPGAMAYMLSPKQYLGDRNPRWMPHLMFYYAGTMPAATWGAGDFAAPIINASAGDPGSSVLTLLVPIRQWSDGSSALPAASN